MNTIKKITKSEILKNLNLARKAHIAWVEKAQLLVHSVHPISKNQLPLEVSNCSFGSWFSNSGQVLFYIMSEKLLKSVENKHEELHNSYLKIFKIYFKQEETALFILERPETIDSLLQTKVEKELRNLENISEEFITLLNRIESNFMQLDDKDLAHINP